MLVTDADTQCEVIHMPAIGTVTIVTKSRKVRDGVEPSPVRSYLLE